MKEGFFAIGAIIMMTPQMGDSAEFSAQPRIETGIMYYEYSQDAFQTPGKEPAVFSLALAVREGVLLDTDIDAVRQEGVGLDLSTTP